MFDTLICEKWQLPKPRWAFWLIGFWWIAAAAGTYAAESRKNESWEKYNLMRYVAKAMENRNAISADRLELLSKAASGVRKAIAEHGSVELVFVCTHNSRRSQFAQAWAAIATGQYRVANVQCHSCGTETTACNARTVAALERAGLHVSTAGDERNPFYSIVYDVGRSPVVLFSKAFGDDSLPKQNFIAMMCCDHADENCPVVSGAIQRIKLSYVDPKISDETGDEAKVYDERCLQIATEMLELMRMVSQD